MGVFGFDHKKRESLVKKKGEIGQKKNKRREREDNFYMLVKEEGRKKNISFCLVCYKSGEKIKLVIVVNIV